MDFVTGHWANLQRFRIDLPRGISKKKWSRIRGEMRERSATKWGLLLELTPQTWEEKHERWQAENAGWPVEDEDSQADEEGSQVDDAESQAENGWSQDEAPEPQSGW